MRISRASGTLEFPADFLLVACCNPCPCGRRRADVPLQRRAARAVPAPALGAAARPLRPPAAGASAPDPDAPTGPTVVRRSRARVVAAVERQEHRLAGTPWRRNAHVAGGALDDARPARARCRRDAGVRCAAAARLTGRGAARVRRVARTIADLDDRAAITADDVERAASMREDVR